MYACPHCGEPIEENATACPHCGSDAETGWSPDAELDGLDLPRGYAPDNDGDDDDDSTAALPRASSIVGPTALALCWVLLVSVGFRAYGNWVIIPGLLLLAVAVVIWRLALRRER